MRPTAPARPRPHSTGSGGRPGVSSVILGARTVEQLDDNLSALGWELTEDETDRLTRVSAPGIPDYPYGFIENNAGSKSWASLGTRSSPFPYGKLSQVGRPLLTTHEELPDPGPVVFDPLATLE